MLGSWCRFYGRGHVYASQSVCIATSRVLPPGLTPVWKQHAELAKSPSCTFMMLMSACGARLLTRARTVVQKLGGVKSVTSVFSFPGSASFHDSDIRMSPLEPFGSLGDLGWCVHTPAPCCSSAALTRWSCRYNIRLALWAFDWELPEAVSTQVRAQ